MIKNEEIKHLIFIETIVFIVFIVAIILLNTNNYNKYKQDLIHNDSYIISQVIENHPELETEVIEYLKNNKGNTNLLNKYGINIESIEYINNLSKKDMIIESIALILIIFIVLVVVNVIFINNIYKEINSIDKYLNDILNGKEKIQLKDYKEGDISNLKNDLLKITLRLKEEKEISEQSKKYLEKSLQDISHQLKTPLTSMYVINDLLDSENTDELLKKELLKKNEKELKRIEWLVTSLLKISQLDSNTIELKKEKVNLKDLINKTLEILKIQIELKEQKIIKPNKDLYLECDLNWTREALLNILKNAHEHTKDTIEIDYKETNFYTQITIKDNGEGINKKDLPYIFDRFYRASTSKESIGIGLNMTKTIIQKQDGVIEVESKKGNTTFIIKFYHHVIWQNCNIKSHLIVI